ncbi:hypothetical protein PIB30_058196 [Stylosanthes scabra]|uniref:CRAL-TRIO domain-containing protein n=1 Tax=Stylosanthes scabra TaxID=79078 RepID=A0ABU6YHA9_9FABA|nr:hypothetical protein [Stylosanthes scabra]
MESPDEMITHVLLSMNQEESAPTHDDNQDQQLGHQCETPVSLQQHYQTAPTKQDLEEREELQRFERDVYGVPPEILTRMFDTYGTNYLEKKTKMPHRVSQLKDHEGYMELLDRDKLKTHSAWLYVLDVDNKEFYIIDLVYSIAPNQQRSKLHKFACNILNQLRVWAGAPSILKKGTILLQLSWFGFLYNDILFLKLRNSEPVARAAAGHPSSSKAAKSHGLWRIHHEMDGAP